MISRSKTFALLLVVCAFSRAAAKPSVPIRSSGDTGSSGNDVNGRDFGNQGGGLVSNDKDGFGDDWLPGGFDLGDDDGDGGDASDMPDGVSNLFDDIFKKLMSPVSSMDGFTSDVTQKAPEFQEQICSKRSGREGELHGEAARGAPSKMKAVYVFSALGIFALIATKGVEAEGHDDLIYYAWLGPSISNAPRISAEAINACCFAASFRRESYLRVLILFLDKITNSCESYHEIVHGPWKKHDICESVLGIDLNKGRQIFCSLFLIGMKKENEKNLRIVLRFLSQTGKELRLEIPVRLLSREEASANFELLKSPDSTFEYIYFISPTRLDDIRKGNPVTFYFAWLNTLLAHGVTESIVPVNVEGYEAQADTYVTRSVLILEEAMQLVFRAMGDY